MTNPAPRLRTDRVELIAATADICRADLDDREFDRLPGLLDAWIPEGAWPPPLLDVDALIWCRDLLDSQPESAGWAIWYLVITDRPREPIGVAGFKGPPDPMGLVELGYSLRPEFQRIGLGTEAIGRLVAWAFEHPEVIGVIADTYDDLIGSIRLLRKLGFHETGEGTDPGAIRYLRIRDSG